MEVNFASKCSINNGLPEANDGGHVWKVWGETPTRTTYTFWYQVATCVDP